MKLNVGNVMKDVLKNKEVTKKMLKDFGYDEEYSEEDMKYIIYAIENCGGLKNKLHASQALIITYKIMDFLTVDNTYEDLGKFVHDLFIEMKVVEER